MCTGQRVTTDGHEAEGIMTELASVNVSVDVPHAVLPARTGTATMPPSQFPYSPARTTGPILPGLAPKRERNDGRG